MIAYFSKSILLLLTSILLAIAFSYNLLLGQNLESLSSYEKSTSDSTLNAAKRGDETNNKPKIKVNIAYPITIGIVSAVALASISYKLEDDPTPGKESFHSKGTSAIVGAIVGFIAGFFITGAIMEIKAKREAKREAQQYKIYHAPSISVKEYVKLEPYLEHYRYGNHCGIKLKFQF